MFSSLVIFLRTFLILLIVFLAFSSFYIKSNKEFNLKAGFINFGFINIGFFSLLLNRIKALPFLLLINNLILLSFKFRIFTFFYKGIYKLKTLIYFYS
jgi:hypothetical protein